MIGRIAGLACICLALPAFAGPNIVQNGSFENGYPLADDTTGLVVYSGVDPALIPGWTVNSGSVDWITTLWTAEDGIRSLDMDGLSAGSISQTLTVHGGQTYDVTFWMAGNPDQGPGIKTLQVSYNDAGPLQAQVYTFAATGTHADMGWTEKQFTFTATSGGGVLRFASLDDPTSDFGPTLDNVSCTAVPEPATLALCAGALSLALARRYRGKRF